MKVSKIKSRLTLHEGLKLTSFKSAFKGCPLAESCKFAEKCPPGSYLDKSKGTCHDNQTDSKVQCPAGSKPNIETGCAPADENKVISDKVAKTKNDPNENEHFHGRK